MNPPGGAGGVAGESDADLGAIRAPAVPPSNADNLTIKEQLALTAKERAEFEHMKSVERLEKLLDIVRKERDDHKGLCDTLRGRCDEWKDKYYGERIEYEKVKITRRGDRWKDAVTAGAALIGGGFISSFLDSPSLFSFGWFLLIGAVVSQLGRSYFDTP